MKTLPLFFGFFLIAPSFAADCDFNKLEITKRQGTTGHYKITNKITLEMLEGMDGRDVFEGPGWIQVNGKRTCKIEGGNFSGFYLSTSKKYLMTQEYSGSCGENRIIDVNNCKVQTVKADYCGTAEVKGNQVVSEPACEPTEKDKAYCTSGKIYISSGKDCAFRLDEKASHALTKRILGLELPLDKGVNISHPKTEKAKIIK